MAKINDISMTSGPALLLQGGGALGAYQAGVYQALHEADIEPAWVAGISIGAINSALIAGNQRSRRLERLEAFWERVTTRGLDLSFGELPFGRQLESGLAAASAALFGQPGFFRPGLPFATPAVGVPGIYDTSPLAETLTELVDFDLLREGHMRLSVGAVEIETGNFAYFDTHDRPGVARTAIAREHVMASGALPPGFPGIVIDSKVYWDGGLVSNTPLQHVLENCGSADLVVFQVDLFSARGPRPTDYPGVLTRQKDIQYSSRTRSVSDYFKKLVDTRRAMRDLLDLVPPDRLDAEQRRRIAHAHCLDQAPSVSLIQMIYRQTEWEGEHKDYEFSRKTMRQHWASGYEDAKLSLTHEDWLKPPRNGEAIVSHDIHMHKGHAKSGS